MNSDSDSDSKLRLLNLTDTIANDDENERRTALL